MLLTAAARILDEMDRTGRDGMTLVETVTVNLALMRLDEWRAGQRPIPRGLLADMPVKSTCPQTKANAARQDEVDAYLAAHPGCARRAARKATQK